MSAPIIEIEGKGIRVYQRVEDNRKWWERLIRRPERPRRIIGAYMMSNSPEITIERKLNAPDSITISPINARSPL